MISGFVQISKRFLAHNFISNMSSFLKLIVALCVSVIAGAAAVDVSKLSAGDPSKFVADPTVIPQLNSTSYGWTEYKQCDGRWSGQQLGTCSLTICSAGCAMSSVAMILATKGAGQNPASFDSWLTQNGGYANGCDIIWSRADAFGKTSFQGIQRASESEICNGLSAGHGIVANVNNGGHWVLLTACLGGGNFAVNDPGYSRTSYSLGEISQEAVYH